MSEWMVDDKLEPPLAKKSLNSFAILELSGTVFPSFLKIPGHVDDASTDHRFLAAILKIRLKFRKMAPSNRVRQDVRLLRDESVAQEYKR